jgi:hypothetical protein
MTVYPLLPMSMKCHLLNQEDRGRHMGSGATVIGLSGAKLQDLAP